MAVIQDVMAGKRTRTQEEEFAEVGKNRGAKTPSTRGFFKGDDMEDEEYEGLEQMERQSTLERVVVRPTAGGRGGVVMDPAPEERPSPDSIADTPSSLVEIPNTENTDRTNREENRERLRERDRSDSLIRIPDWLQEVRSRPAAVKPNKLAPSNLTKGLDTCNIEAAMINAKPGISFPQLLDVSPHYHVKLAVCSGGFQTRWSCLHATV